MGNKPVDPGSDIRMNPDALLIYFRRRPDVLKEVMPFGGAGRLKFIRRRYIKVEHPEWQTWGNCPALSEPEIVGYKQRQRLVLAELANRVEQQVIEYVV
jgi:hypothetical protein